MNAGELKEPRLSLFNDLLTLVEKYRRKNQVHLISVEFKI